MLSHEHGMAAINLCPQSLGSTPNVQLNDVLREVELIIFLQKPFMAINQEISRR